ncbi:MAG: tetratricopeptide repeat protein [Candidatus Liptonbacteria bacterium]|nr:tetratricopeptide repeat protein [Candidatus Liptonbacteria bacterium]
MSSTIKKVISIIAVLFLAFIAYYGSYLPYEKSHSFIRTVRGMNGARSLEEFKDLFRVPLDIPSPIGQEELVRNMASEVASFISQGSSSAEIEEELVYFVEEYFNPIVAREKGMSFEQDLYILSTLRRILFNHTKKAGHLDAAEKYFLKGLELGPRRPQFLYGLLDVYLIRRDAERSKLLADQIYAQWPSDNRVAELLKAIEAGVITSSTATSTKKK